MKQIKIDRELHKGLKLLKRKLKKRSLSKTIETLKIHYDYANRGVEND